MGTPSKHSSFVVFIFCILLTISCNKGKKNEMNIEELNSFGKRYAQAWSGQDPERVADFFAANGALTVNDGEVAIGREAITKVAKGFMDAFPDMVVLMDSLVIKSGKAQFHWTLTGTNTAEGGAGNKVEISGLEEWRMNEDGLVQESFGSFDSEEYDRQLNGTN